MTNNTTGGTIVPGQDNTIMSTIVVTNNVPDTATNQTVTDPLSNTATWTATASMGSSVTTPSGTGSISDTVTLLSGGTATFLITTVVHPDASATSPTGNVVNTATVSAPVGDNTPADNTSTDPITLTPVSDLSIHKTDNVGGTFNAMTNTTTGATPTAGQTILNTIVVTNGGPSTAVNVPVTDNFPGVISVNWTGSDGSSGTSNISDTIPSL